MQAEQLNAEAEVESLAISLKFHDYISYVQPVQPAQNLNPTEFQELTDAGIYNLCSFKYTNQANNCTVANCYYYIHYLVTTAVNRN